MFPSPAEGDLGCFQVLVIMNRAAVTSVARFCGGTCFQSTGSVSRSVNTGLYVKSLGRNDKLACEVPAPAAAPSSE